MSLSRGFHSDCPTLPLLLTVLARQINVSVNILRQRSKAASRVEVASTPPPHEHPKPLIAEDEEKPTIGAARHKETNDRTRSRALCGTDSAGPTWTTSSRGGSSSDVDEMQQRRSLRASTIAASKFSKFLASENGGRKHTREWDQGGGSYAPYGGSVSDDGIRVGRNKRGRKKVGKTIGRSSVERALWNYLTYYATGAEHGHHHPSSHCCGEQTAVPSSVRPPPIVVVVADFECFPDVLLQRLVTLCAAFQEEQAAAARRIAGLSVLRRSSPDTRCANGRMSQPRPRKRGRPQESSEGVKSLVKDTSYPSRSSARPIGITSLSVTGTASTTACSTTSASVSTGTATPCGDSNGGGGGGGYARGASGHRIIENHSVVSQNDDRDHGGSDHGCGHDQGIGEKDGVSAVTVPLCFSFVFGIATGKPAVHRRLPQHCTCMLTVNASSRLVRSIFSKAKVDPPPISYACETPSLHPPS